MLIKIDVNSDLVTQIQKLIDSKRFSDIHQFITIAIGNQLHEEISGVTLELDSKPTTQLDEIPESLDEKQGEIVKHLWEFSPQTSEFKPETEEMICPFYTRFFPVKVIIHKLGSMLSFEQPWIEIRELQNEAFTFVEKVSTKLREIEEVKQLPRNKKLSTGLPIPKTEISGLKGIKKRKKEEKYQSSQNRFKEQFVGKVRRKEPYFSGACFSMGLIAVKFEAETCLISLTTEGKDFALINNPILDENNFEYSFSDQEISFILENIYPKFEAENRIIHQIIQALENKNLQSDDINEIFESQNRKDFRAERVSTMGKLSELRIVNWKINQEGKSIYSLNEDNLGLLN